MIPAKKQKKRCEFSKLILGLVMACYFFGVGLGAVLVARSPEMLGEYLAFIGAPVAVAIAFYSWKAKAENVLKLSQTQAEKLDKIHE